MSSTHKIMYGTIIVGHIYREMGLVVTGLYFNIYKVSYTNVFYKNLKIRINFAHTNVYKLLILLTKLVV